MNIRYFIFIFSALLLWSCKSFYNETIVWMDSIEVGSKIEEVKNSQPEFVEIEWESPFHIDTEETWYTLINIQGNRDFLEMQHFLIFNSNGFAYRKASK